MLVYQWFMIPNRWVTRNQASLLLPDAISQSSLISYQESMPMVDYRSTVTLLFYWFNFASTCDTTQLPQLIAFQYYIKNARLLSFIHLNAVVPYHKIWIHLKGERTLVISSGSSWSIGCIKKLGDMDLNREPAQCKLEQTNLPNEANVIHRYVFALLHLLSKCCRKKKNVSVHNYEKLCRI